MADTVAKVARDWSEYARNLKRDVHHILAETAKPAQGIAQEDAPKVTGRLRESIVASVEADRLALYASAPYADIVHARIPYTEEALKFAADRVEVLLGDHAERRLGGTGGQ